jgi:hypothetical protein
MLHTISDARNRARNLPTRFSFASFAVAFQAVALIISDHGIHSLEMVLKISQTRQ